jgi:adenylate kinase family enzyme
VDCVVRGPGDPLAPSTARLLVTGASGAGKSTLRQTISDILGLPTVEMDSLFHGPGWTQRPSFVTDVDRFTAGPRWVTEWQYTLVRAMLVERADTLVWLDHSRATVMRRVVRRTLHRRIHRVELWNGNQEPPLSTIFTDPEHIIRWSWTTYHKQRRLADDVARQPDGPVVVRLRGQAEVDAWIRGPLRTLAEQRD